MNLKKTLSDKISIIVSSSDGYDDCWYPFFTLLKNYFPGIEQIEILLSTQTKDYSYPGFNLKVVKHGTKVAWSQRLRQTMEEASNEIILLLDEDSFLRSPAKVELLSELVNLMVDNEKISHIRLTKGNWETTTNKEFNILEELLPKSKNRFLLQAGFWKKEVLKRHLADHESTWEVEKWGNYRANILKYSFYCVSKSIVKKVGPLYNTSANGGIYKGKWIESYVVPLFSKNNINVDFSKRGFYNQKVRFLSRIKMIIRFLTTPVPNA